MADHTPGGGTETATSAPAGRASSWRLRGLVVVGGLTLVAFAYYLVGLMLHDATAGSCRAWEGCGSSARQEWTWDQGYIPEYAVMVTVFYAVTAFGWSWIRDRPTLRLVISLLALLVVVPVVGLSAFLAAGALHNDCRDSDFFCFSGPEEAILLAVPGVLGGLLALALLMGLLGGRGRTGTTFSTLGVTVLAASVASLCALNVTTEALYYVTNLSVR